MHKGEGGEGIGYSTFPQPFFLSKNSAKAGEGNPLRENMQGSIWRSLFFERKMTYEKKPSEDVKAVWNTVYSIIDSVHYEELCMFSTCKTLKAFEKKIIIEEISYVQVVY